MDNYSNYRSALIIGHPGHELRVFKFVKDFKPRVYILTDGSGYDRSSRVYNSRRILESQGATCADIMGVFSDYELYQIILKNKVSVLEDLIKTIYFDLTAHNINFLFGDAIEGFNPTHDVCRYLINILVEIHSIKLSKQVSNFDFNLDGLPEECPVHLRSGMLSRKLNDAEISAKIEAAKNYPELKEDVEHTLNKFGHDAFRTECLRPVKNRKDLRGWQTSKPQYEIFGGKRVSDGQYEQVITFKDHVEPLANQLWGLVNKF